MRPNLGKRAIGFLWVLLLGYSSTLAPTSLSLGIVCGLLGLTVFGVLWGNAEAYLRLFWSKRLIHVMTLDLLFCAALLPYLIGKLRRPEDIEQEPSWAKALLWLPLFGPALWNALYYRPATLSFQPDQ